MIDSNMIRNIQTRAAQKKKQKLAEELAGPQRLAAFLDFGHQRGNRFPDCPLLLMLFYGVSELFCDDVRR